MLVIVTFKGKSSKLQELKSNPFEFIFMKYVQNTFAEKICIQTTVLL